MGELSDHFTWAEAVYSETASRLEIFNGLPDDVREHVKLSAQGMEKVRGLLAHPIHVNSWYRSPALNRAVNGAKDSAHMYGWAVDFVCPGFGTPLEIVKAIVASPIVFDKCIQEGSWVHISFGPLERRQGLTAHFAADGTVTYTQGVA